MFVIELLIYLFGGIIYFFLIDILDDWTGLVSKHWLYFKFIPMIVISLVALILYASFTVYLIHLNELNFFYLIASLAFTVLWVYKERFFSQNTSE